MYMYGEDMYGGKYTFNIIWRIYWTRVKLAAGDQPSSAAKKIINKFKNSEFCFHD